MSVILGFVRTIVFLAGMFFGYMFGVLVLSFGGSAATDFTGVFGGFGLMLAAPLCWIAAVRGRKGDPWTLGYVGAWAVFLGVVMSIGAAERGDPVTPASDDVGLWALGLLALVYLVILPVLVLRHRRRKVPSGPGVTRLISSTSPHRGDP
ncbi:MAG: hypothetical protein M3P97_00625 [Actinomycetota bacterium]|nr:hypothetical protein [Actinomycetota bacterium]